jgi:hypothetical protein
MASKSAAPTESMGDSRLLWRWHTAFVVSAENGSIFLSPGFSQGVPLTSTYFSARTFRTLWLMWCSPEILVSQAPVADK